MKLLVLLALVGLAVPATAADLAGTYAGKAKCVETRDGQPTTRKKFEVTARISESLVVPTGSIINVVFNSRSLQGDVFFDVKKPANKAVGVMVDCQQLLLPEDLVSGMMFFKAKVKPGSPKGTLKFTSIFHEVGKLVETCKGSLKRVSAIDPNVEFCETFLP